MARDPGQPQGPTPSQIAPSFTWHAHSDGGPGRDIRAAQGTTLFSPVAGTVHFVGFVTRADGSPSYGNLIVIRDVQGNLHYFAHLESINKRFKKGDTVAAASVIGKVGSTGNSSGPHLHYEIRAAGGGYIDPVEKWGDNGNDLLFTGTPGQKVKFKDYSGSPLAGPASAGSSAAATPADAGLGPNATDAEILRYIRENYPEVEDYLGIPQLKRIIFDAIREDANANVIRSRIEASDWWENRTEAARRADILKASDPTEYKSQIREIANSLREPVTQLLGRHADWDFLEKKAERILRGDFDQATFLTNLKNRLAGQEGSNIREEAERDLSQAAADYLLPLENAGEWAKGVLRGVKSENDFKAFLQEQAASLYTPFADMIRAGATPRQLAEPYVQMLSRELDRVYGADDPMVQAALRQGTTLSDFLGQVRERPEWGGSIAAKEQAYQLRDEMGKMFGAIA